MVPSLPPPKQTPCFMPPGVPTLWPGVEGWASPSVPGVGRWELSRSVLSCSLRVTCGGRGLVCDRGGKGRPQPPTRDGVP